MNEKEQQQRYQDCNCETILQPLSENKVNIYELLDRFVSYVLATKPDITPNSLSLYITVLKSYFAYYDIDVIPSKFRCLPVSNFSDILKEETKNDLDSQTKPNKGGDAIVNGL